MQYELDNERNGFAYYAYIFATAWSQVKFAPKIHMYAVHKNKRISVYLPIKEVKRAGKAVTNKVRKNADFLKKWKKFIFEKSDELQKFCHKIENTNLRMLSDRELLKIYNHSSNLYVEIGDGVVTVRTVNRNLQEELLQLCRDPEKVPILMSTSEQSFIGEEHKEMLGIAERLKEGENLKGMIEEHTKKWHWMSCGFADEKEKTEEDFKKELEEIMEKNESAKKIEVKKEEKIKEREELIKKLNLSDETKRLIEFASTCTYFKDFIRGNLNRLQCVNRKIFAEIGRRIGKKWEEVAELIPEEVREELMRGKKIAERDKVVFYSDTKEVRVLSGEKADRKIEELETSLKFSEEVKEIKGIGASGGKARGKILIVNKIEDASKNKNFVLVSTMTTPDLVPAMKRAVAIVTDEGGLTCHAAIVSRELGIPCVVGTKIATKVLRDGDEVEVNADKGIVRKIKN